MDVMAGSRRCAGNESSNALSETDSSGSEPTVQQSFKLFVGLIVTDTRQPEWYTEHGHVSITLIARFALNDC